MHQKNIDKIAEFIAENGVFCTPLWTVRTMYDGVLEYENLETGKCLEMTMETFTQDFLPKLPNFVQMHAQVVVDVDASIMIPDDVSECDYEKYAMEHKLDLFDSDSDERLLNGYTELLGITEIL